MHKRVYFDYLDSLRFFAFFVVFIAHSAILFPISSDWFYTLYRNLISNGSYGVNFFFILSGFLITYLLLAEKKETGSISIRFFYLKRVLRIWPLYYLVFFISIFIIPILISWLGSGYVEGDLNTFTNLNKKLGDYGHLWFMFFMGNFYRAYDLGLVPFALGVLWSVCVEEQFYLFWPIIVKKFNNMGILIISFLIFSISLIYKAIHINDANIAYYGTVSVAMDLASGCILGLFYFRFEKQVRAVWYFILNSINSYEIFKKNSSYLIKIFNRVIIGFFRIDKKGRNEKSKSYFDIVLGIVLIGSMVVYISMLLIDGGRGLIYDTLRLLKRPVLDLFFIIILLSFLFRKPRQLIESLNTDINTSASAYRSASNTWYNRFTYLGRISYGLYAYHAIFLILVLAIFNHLGMGPNEVTVFRYLSVFTLSLTLTIIASHYSYKYMEGPCIRLRRYFKNS